MCVLCVEWGTAPLFAVEIDMRSDRLFEFAQQIDKKQPDNDYVRFERVSLGGRGGASRQSGIGERLELQDWGMRWGVLICCLCGGSLKHTRSFE